jgi:hypothetical protein
MGKDKKAVKTQITKKFTGFDNVDIELGPELGVNFDEDGNPTGKHSKKFLHERKNEPALFDYDKDNK